jgi:hypothetical protein
VPAVGQRSLRTGRGPSRPDTDHAGLPWMWPWPAEVAVPERCPAGQSPCRRRLPQGPLRVRAGGHPPIGSRTPSKGATAADTSMAIVSGLSASAGHLPSGRRSFRKQRTVNPLTAPARYNFLYSSSSACCSAPHSTSDTSSLQACRPCPVGTFRLGRRFCGCRTLLSGSSLRMPAARRFPARMSHTADLEAPHAVLAGTCRSKPGWPVNR